MLLMFSLN